MKVKALKKLRKKVEFYYRNGGNGPEFLVKNKKYYTLTHTGTDVLFALYGLHDPDAELQWFRELYRVRRNEEESKKLFEQYQKL
ncbi:MAG: hypothetical protein LBU90_09185 [Bacteroidales bacterium]|jgi:hypothetical protein|nr:hypothetical protein [Bacteroidales bacterium]